MLVNQLRNIALESRVKWRNVFPRWSIRMKQKPRPSNPHIFPQAKGVLGSVFLGRGVPTETSYGVWDSYQNLAQVRPNVVNVLPPVEFEGPSTRQARRSLQACWQSASNCAETRG